MTTKTGDNAKTRTRSVAKDLTARTRLTGGILYNGHAGLGANVSLADASPRALAPGRVVTDNKDPDGTY
jgi:hypothetical protein